MMNATARRTLLALALLWAGCATSPDARRIDDFESGTLDAWEVDLQGSGGWFPYRDGKSPPSPSESDPSFPFEVPDPPEGAWAAVTDMRGPGRQILHTSLSLDRAYALHLTLFYVSGGAPFAEAGGEHLEGGQQVRIDVMRADAPLDSLAAGDVLATVFRTSHDSAAHCAPTPIAFDLSRWAGQTVRLRISNVNSRGPLRAGIDDLYLAPIDAAGDAAEAAPVAVCLNERLSEPEAIAALSARLEALARADRFSGVVLVAKEGTVLLHQPWGRADRERNVPMTVDSQLRLGSMNKMFTAVAILQLVEAGLIALDEPLIAYLPDYPNQELARSVTIRHLLTHTGGTGDVFDPPFPANRDQLREHEDYLRLYGSRPALFPAGSRFAYSNFGFVLLGLVVERVTATSYYDRVRATVFDRAGMLATASLPESADVPSRAVSYRRAGDAWVSSVDALPHRGTAAGGGYGTAADLLRFAGALSTGSLLSSAMLAEATREQVPGTQYGHGFAVAGEGAVRHFGHSGGGPGISAEMRVYPALGYVVVCLSNLDPPACVEPMNTFEAQMPTMR